MSERPPLERPPVRVLCYSPYTMWELHGLWETTILHGLRLRGADVRYVLCDGIYAECDPFSEATGARPLRNCAECQGKQAALMHRMGMDFEWIGRYTLPSELREARAFSESVADAALPTVAYGDWQIGAWVESSVNSYFRSAQLDLGDPRVAGVFRRYVESGLAAAFGIERLLDDYRPDVMLQFNGRQSSTRVALELGRARGIRVVTHETGVHPGALKLIENARCTSLEPIRRTWREWGGTPLAADEVETVREILDAREQGRNQWRRFNPAAQTPAAVRRQLGLRDGAPLWVLFMSSDDELAAEEELRGPFERQLDWIESTLAFAASRPELDLVVRAHPNLGSRRSIGVNRSLLATIEDLARRLPPNVRLVRPDDDVDSYALMDACDAGLIWYSSVAIELALKGKRAVVAAGSVTRGFGFTLDVETADGYHDLLDELLESRGEPALDEVRLAHRWAYAAFVRLDVRFPLVDVHDPPHGRLAYSTIEALAPGRDAALDRVCRIVLDGEPVCPPPTPAEASRSTADEDAFLARLARSRSPRFTVVASAAELVREPGLLEAWGSHFGAFDAATLAIETPPELVDALVDTVAHAGLDGEDGPELVAVSVLPAAPAARLSRTADPGLPTFPPERAGELRALAEHLWSGAA